MASDKSFEGPLNHDGKRQVAIEFIDVLFQSPVRTASDSDTRDCVVCLADRPTRKHRSGRVGIDPIWCETLEEIPPASLGLAENIVDFRPRGDTVRLRDRKAI